MSRGLLLAFWLAAVLAVAGLLLVQATVPAVRSATRGFDFVSLAGLVLILGLAFFIPTKPPDVQ